MSKTLISIITCPFLRVAARLAFTGDFFYGLFMVFFKIETVAQDFRMGLLQR